MHGQDMHDDDFFGEVEQTAKTWMVIAAIGNFLSFLLVVLTIYFFLAAAGVVPRLDLIPLIPFV